MTPPAVARTRSGRSRLNRTALTWLLVAESLAALGILAWASSNDDLRIGCAAAAAVLLFATIAWTVLRRRPPANVPVQFTTSAAGLDDGRRLPWRLTVADTVSRTSGPIGVLADAQGLAAGLELELGGAIDEPLRLPLDRLIALAADDASQLCGVQLRVGFGTPGAAVSRTVSEAARSWRGLGAGAVIRYAHLIVRLEPLRSPDVVAAHGGGQEGARSALAAAIDRLSAALRREGIRNRPVDADALTSFVRAMAMSGQTSVWGEVTATDSTALGEVTWALANVTCRAATLSMAVELDGGATSVRSAVWIATTDDADAARTVALLGGVAAIHVLSETDVPAARALVLPLGGGPLGLLPMVA